MGRRLENITVKAETWFCEDLTLEERGILIELERRINHAQNNAKFAWLLTNNSLAIFAKISERKICQILAKLESLNYIIIKNNGTRNRIIEITTHETTHETTQNVRGLEEKIRKIKKSNKKNKKNSKQASIKKEINDQARMGACELSEKKCADYNEIFDGFCVYGQYRESVIEFIKFLKANKGVMLNSRLERLIILLDRAYGTDDNAKAQEINNAIASGYKRLPVEYDA